MEKELIDQVFNIERAIERHKTKLLDIAEETSFLILDILKGQQ